MLFLLILVSVGNFPDAFPVSKIFLVFLCISKNPKTMEDSTVADPERNFRGNVTPTKKLHIVWNLGFFCFFKLFFPV